MIHVETKLHIISHQLKLFLQIINKIGCYVTSTEPGKYLALFIEVLVFLSRIMHNVKQFHWHYTKNIELF